MHSTANLPPLAILKKNQVFVGEKTSIFFSKNTQILNVLANLTISVAFYYKFAHIW